MKTKELETVINAYFHARDLHPSGTCAFSSKSDSAVNALAILENNTWSNIYNRLILAAQKTGLMPDDCRCIRQLFYDSDLFPQNSSYCSRMTLFEFCDNMRSAFPEGNAKAIIVSGHSPAYPSFAAVLPYKDKLGKCSYRIESNRLRDTYGIQRIWMKWTDNLDHSPAPSKMIPSGLNIRKCIQSTEDHKFFHFYQPNPCSNSTGDCVIRATSAVLNISWCEAVDRLAKAGNNEYTTLNDSKQLPKMLKKCGMEPLKAITHDKALLNGEQFCEYATHRFKNGERLFVNVGRSHVVGVVPTDTPQYGQRYAVWDSWDCTKRKMGDFWVYNPNVAQKVEDCIHFTSGMRLLHPVYGNGLICRTDGEKERMMLTVTFDKFHEPKRISAQWSKDHCEIIA